MKINKNETLNNVTALISPWKGDAKLRLSLWSNFHSIWENNRHFSIFLSIPPFMISKSITNLVRLYGEFGPKCLIHTEKKDNV